MSIRTQASLRVSLGYPHWLGDCPRCSQTFHNRSHGAPIPVIRVPRYSEGQPECPLRVWFSSEFDPSKFTLRLLSHTPGGSQWLKYILLMLDGKMWALARKKTQWKENLIFSMKLARQKLSKYSAEVTPSMGMLLIPAQIMNSFRKLRSFRQRDKAMDINAEDERSYTTQCQEGFLQTVKNGQCAKHRQVPVI